MRPHLLANPLLAHVPIAVGHDVGGEPHVAGRRLDGDDGAVGDIGDLTYRGLDLAELDPEAADLHLVVDPPAEVELTVGKHTSDVAGPVEPPRPERVRDEALGGQLRAVQVAARDAGAADEQLTGCPRGYRLAFRVEHVRSRGPGSAMPIGLLSRAQSAALSGR